jgi:Peptidase family S41/Tricorn protease C1 domain
MAIRIPEHLFASSSIQRTAAALCAALCVAWPAHAAPPKNLDGLWLTDGYRSLIEIQGDVLKIRQLTPLSCLFDLKAKRTADGAGPNEARFLDTASSADISAQAALTLRAGKDDDHLLLHVDGAVSDIDLSRTATMPAPCALPPVADTPINNFDIFASTFAENYPFFELRGVDWAAVTAAERAKITPATTEAELFEIFKGMIAPLQDAHTYVGARSLRTSYGGWRPPEPKSRAERFRATQIIDKQYVRGPLKAYCNRQLQFGMLDDGVAYLRIRSYAQYAKEGDFATQLATLDAALDEIFSKSSKWAGLVIDVRINGGGSDVFGISIASRLATVPYLAYTKVIRNDPVNPDGRSRPQPVLVKTSDRPSFAGNVALLIGHESVSAAETQAQALLNRTPHVQMIGRSTQGVFSDVMSRRMPNGWEFGLPNEIFLTESGQAFDAVGVPPEVQRPVFARRDLLLGKDPALDTAIRRLSRSAPTVQAR